MTNPEPTPEHTTPDDPSTFDIDAYIQGLAPATFKAPLYRKANLVEKIEALSVKIDAAQKESAAERSMSEGVDVAALIAEHNDLVREFDAAVDWFEFRPVTSDDVTAAKAALEADGKTADDDTEFLCYQMAGVCLSHPGITGAGMSAIRHRLGDAAIRGLVSAWYKALGAGGDRAVPFSPLPLPTPTTTE